MDTFFPEKKVSCECCGQKNKDEFKRTEKHSFCYKTPKIRNFIIYTTKIRIIQ